MNDNISRPLGDGVFNVSYEVKVGLPVDARLQVNTKNALLDGSRGVCGLQSTGSQSWEQLSDQTTAIWQRCRKRVILLNVLQQTV